MNKKLNKLVTNYPVELNEEEIENLSATLAPVIAACGGGGGTGGKIYTGTGFVNVNNTTNQIGLTEDANDKLNKEYVEYNEYSTAIANRYTKTQTNALLDEKQDTLDFEYDENNKVSAINGSALAGQGGTNYTAGTNIIIDEYNRISVDTNGNPNNTASNTRNFVEGSWTVASGYNSHAEGVATSALGYGVHAQGMWTKFSSSKWSDSTHEPTDIYWADGAGATVEGYCNATTSCPMSGTIGGSDYGPIHGGIIKVIGNGYRQHRLETEPAEYFPSDALIIYRDGCISAAGNISANGIELGAGGGGTTYQGRNGVNVDGGYVELTTTAYNAVTSVSSISNDVDTLKGASGNWNKVSDKLDTTAFSTVSGDFLIDNDLNDYYKKTETSSKEALETAFGNKQDNLTQEQLSAISSVSSKLTKASADTLYAQISVTGDVDTLKSSSGDWNKVSDKLDTTAFSTVSGDFLTEIPDDYALKTDIPTTVAQLTDSGNYYQKTDTSSKTEITNALNTKVDKPTSIQTGKLVYDGDTSAWVSLPAGTTTIVQGQGSVTATYDSPNSTYTVSLLSSAEQALAAVDGKVSKPTALTNKYLVLRTDSNGDVSGWYDLQDQSYSKSEAQGTFVHRDMLDNGTGGTLTGTGLTGGTVLGVNTNVIQTKLTDEQLSAISEVSSKLDRADLDDYVPYSATKLAIGSNNDISVNNSDNTFAQGTNNKVSTSPYSFVQGEANSAVNYYNLAQGYGNYAQDHSLAQGTNNTAISVSFAQGQNCTAESYTFTQGTNNSAVTTSFAQGSANKARYDSFAQGNRNSAFSQSLAQGHYNSADDGSLAQGKHNTAYSHSFAQGSMNYADNNAMAQGGDNTAKYFSQALGFGLSIQGSRGTQDGDAYLSGGLAIGTYNQTSAGVAFVVGNGHSNGAGVEPTRSDAFLIYPDGSVSAKGDISANGVKLGGGGGGDLSNYVPFSATELPIGTNNTATQTAAAIGLSNTASVGSFALGKENTATNTACAIGSANSAGNGSFVAGRRSTAYDASVAFEESNYASGRSVAFGHSNTAKNYSYTFGRGLGYTGDTPEQWNMGAFVIGCWNNTTTWDYANNSACSPLFIVGNGASDNNTKDAFIVYRNGAVNAGYVNTNTVNGSYSFIEGRDNHDVGTAGCNHIEGGYNSLSGLYSHAEGNLNRMSADHSHIEGYRNEFNTSTYDWGIHIGGMLNATTAQTNDHGGILRLIGNGTRHKSGDVEITARSDAYILYRDGTVSAKQFQNADGTETINGTTYNFSGVDNIEILPNAATANTANFPNDNVLRFILES